jgi:hypothetical protein
MERWHRMRPIERRSLGTCTLVVVSAFAWIVGASAVSAICGLAAFALGAAAAGVDSRAPGDWTSTPRV